MPHSSLPPFETERPRERCLRFGPTCLSLRECLALLIGTGPSGKGCLGLAHDLLERPGAGLPEGEQERAFFTAMEVSAIAHLRGLRGLGDAQQARILASFELGRRYALFRERTRERRPRATGPKVLTQALSRLAPELRADPQEWIGFVPVYRNGGPGEFCLAEHGVRTHVNFDPAEFFARLLALRPRGFVLFHNHPSGDLRPSATDYELTQQMRFAARPFGVELLAHGIVGNSGETWIDGSG